MNARSSVFCLALCSSISFPLMGQYKIKNSVVNNGAATQVHAEKTIRGTTGQHLVGKTTSPLHTVTAGYWAFSSNVVTHVETMADPLPINLTLSQNYPNPFNASTTIRFTLPRSDRVSLRLYDRLGREIEILLEGQRAAGTHKITLDGGQLASGLYFYRLLTKDFSAVRKLMLIK